MVESLPFESFAVKCRLKTALTDVPAADVSSRVFTHLVLADGLLVTLSVDDGTLDGLFEEANAGPELACLDSLQFTDWHTQESTRPSTKRQASGNLRPMPPSEMTLALLKALEAGGYDAKPGKLMQGSFTAFPPAGLTKAEEEEIINEM